MESDKERGAQGVSEMTRPLTLDNHVARICHEAYSAWVNEQGRTTAGLEYRLRREAAFEAGVRAALSSLPQAMDARRAVCRD